MNDLDFEDEDAQPTKRVTITIVLDVDDDFSDYHESKITDAIDRAIEKIPEVIFIDVSVESGPIV